MPPTSTVGGVWWVLDSARIAQTEARIDASHRDAVDTWKLLMSSCCETQLRAEAIQRAVEIGAYGDGAVAAWKGITNL